jgi:hypothetical protein
VSAAVPARGPAARGSEARPVRAAVRAVAAGDDARGVAEVQCGIELLRVRDRSASEAVAAVPTVI